VDVVRCDSEEGAYHLTRLLLGLGHRQIALVTGPAGVTTADDRARGFLRATAEAGARQADVYRGAFSLESGFRLAGQALARHPRPTALVAANNFLAIGALRAIQDAGLEVPDEIALAGFDDLPATMVVEPFLTAAVQPAYEMGRQAAELLIRRLAGSEAGPPQEILLPVELVIRQSSGLPLG
jgi:LacI family transcriptional regulator